MPKKYRVVFHGISGDAADFKSRMVRRGAVPATVDAMVRKAPIILKQGISLDFASRYAEAVRKAGGRVMVQEWNGPEKSGREPISIASFKDFMMCPECGFKQQKREFCLKCGSRLVKTAQSVEPKNVAGH